jgi:hypothetical protein
MRESGYALAGYDRVRLEVNLEAVNLEAVVREGGETGGETVFIGELVIVQM